MNDDRHGSGERPADEPDEPDDVPIEGDDSGDHDAGTPGPAANGAADTEPTGTSGPGAGALAREEDDETERQPPPAPGGRRGRGTRAMDPERPCMNCGDPTPGEYCPTCGQRKVDVQVSVRTLVMEVLEDQFILDKRLPRTLGALLFKPGHMTVEHVNGRIVRYIHPFRLYLVTSLLFFVLLSFFSMRFVRTAANEDGGRSIATVVDSLDQELAATDSTIAHIDRVLADTTHSATLRTTLEATRAELVQRQAALEARQDSADRSTADTTTAADTSAEGGEPEADPPAGNTGRAGEAAGTGATGEGDDSQTLSVAFGWDEEEPDINTGIAVIDSALTGQIRRLGSMEPREAAETLVGTFFNYAPTMMFILLPLFAGVLKLLYIRRGRYYAEHFVFLLHVHSFVFILATVMLLLGSWARWLEAGLSLWMLVYIYMAMKRVYGQGWFKTFIKYWTLGWMYFWILTFAIPLAFIATLFLF